jgi:hypothetical protein
LRHGASQSKSRCKYNCNHIVPRSSTGRNRAPLDREMKPVENGHGSYVMLRQGVKKAVR